MRGSMRGNVRSRGRGKRRPYVSGSPVIGGEGGDLKVDLRPFAAPDPLALLLLDALGPVQRVQAVQQAVGVGRDLQIPLGDVFFSTSAPLRQPRPLTTSSFARTVLSTGSQLTGAFCL